MTEHPPPTTDSFMRLLSLYSRSIVRHFRSVKVLSYDALARDFRKTWTDIEQGGAEVVITRDDQPVARIVPETKGLSAAAMFGDLHGILGEAAGAKLARKLAEVRKGKPRKGTLRELRNPWASD